jgi:Ca2+-binding RTX toxin-like protein
VALNDDGSFAFTYPDGLTGSFSFTYRVTDGTADSAPATVTLTRAPNALPASGNDGYRLPFASPFSVSAADGVLRNDADADRDPLTVTVVAPPPVGTLTLRPDGSFDYAFPPTLVGSVTFTYRASDGVEEGNVATVTLTRERLVAVSGRQLIVIGTGGPDTVRISPAGGRTLLVTIQTPDQLTWQVMNPGPLPFTGITVRLGAGNDRLDVVAGSIPVTAVGGAGDDVIHTGLGNDDITGDDTFGGPAGDDVIDAGGGRNTVAAGDGDNVVRTGAGPDTITAGDGRQEIHAGGGNDSITVGTGGSFIDAGAGNDRVTAAGGQNWVQGGSGNDILIGGADGDALFGEGGNDLLVGGTGADFLDGGLGNDLLFDGRVAVNDPARDSLARVLASYAPSRHASLVNITNRLTVTPDPAATDNLTGGLGVDWFWSNDSLEALDRVASEPLNAVH